MSLCINPNCSRPNNPDNQLYCQACGSELLLEGLYRVQRQLGGGGFGKVYELSSGNTLKILKILTLSQPIALKLFQQEAEVLGKLNHPGIPKVEPDGYFIYFPKDSEEPLHCLVMEKIEGENLEIYLNKKGKPISQKLALKWLIEIAEILDKVHQQGFLHRDIKPPNIMLRPNGQLVLIDFGTVKQITATVMASEAKKQGTGVYTPGYAPPEQEKGFTVLKSDFYALGRTFVHLLTNKHPLAFYNPNTDELDWRGAVPNLSPLLGDLLDELMQRLAKDRPKDTGVILQRLGEIEQRLYPPLPSSLPKPEISPPPQPLVKTLPPRNLLPLWITGFIGTVLVLGIGTHIYQSSRSNPESSLSSSTSPFVSPPTTSSNSIKTLTGHFEGVNSLAISPDNRTIVSGGFDKTIKIWDLTTGKLIRTLTGHSDSVYSVAISPDGQTIISGSARWGSNAGDNSIKIWDLSTGKLLRTLIGHSDGISSVVINPDGQTIISGSEDNTIKIWRLER
jgi:serine/threonine protein kinase